MIAKKLYRITRSNTPVKDLEKFVGRAIEDTFRGLGRYLEKVEKIE